MRESALSTSTTLPNPAPHTRHHPLIKNIPPLPALLFRHTATLAWLAGIFAARWPTPACIVCLLLCWVDSRCRRPAALFIVLTAFTLGLCITHSILPQRPLLAPSWVKSHEKIRIHGTVHEVQGMPNKRLRIILNDVLPLNTANIPDVHTPPPLPIRLAWTWEEPLTRPVPGQKVEITLKIRSTAGSANISLPNYDGIWVARGLFWRSWSKTEQGNPHISGTPDTLSHTREWLRNILVTALAHISAQDTATSTKHTFALPQIRQDAAFIPALLFGDRTFLTQQNITMLASASLLHSIALSGQHLAFMALLALILAYSIGILRPQSYLYLPRISMSLLLTLPLAMLYLWLGDAPPSLIRAASMLFLLVLWHSQGQHHTPLDILLDALLLISVWQPLMVYEVGLQLSALAVAALACSVPLLRRTHMAGQIFFCKRMHNSFSAKPPLYARFCLSCWDIGLCSFVITLALLPPSLFYFQNTGWWFPLNILWLPVLGAWVMPLSFISLALLACGLTSIAHLTITAAIYPCDLLLTILHFLHEQGWLTMPALPQPHWLFWLAWICFLLTLCVRIARPTLPKAGQRLLLASFLCFAAWLSQLFYGSNPVRLLLLDVGQGQAAVIEGTCGWRMLADGGNKSVHFDNGSAVVIPRLCADHLPKLNTVLLTHPDMDHIGGLFTVLQKMHVDTVFHNGALPTNSHAAKWQELLEQHNSHQLYAGDVIEIEDGLKLEVLHPPHGYTRKGNNASIVMRLVRNGEGLLLLTGDAERHAIKTILANNFDVRAHIVVAPHHGANSAFFAGLYAAAQPDVILVSSAKDGRWRHPGNKIINYAAKHHIPLLATATFGEIDVTWQPHEKWQLNYARPTLREDIPVTWIDAALEDLE